MPGGRDGSIMPDSVNFLDANPEGLSELPLYHFINWPRVPPTSGHRPPLLLMLHGIGGSEFDLYGLSPYLDPRFLVLSLRAPISLRPDSYAWFEVVFSDSGPVINPKQAEASRRLLIAFIKQAPVSFGTDQDQTYLMGFSQGAIMSLALALTQPDLLAGVVAISGRTLPELFAMNTPLGDKLAPDGLIRGLPLFVVHGRFDRVLSIDYGRSTRDRFSTLPVNLTYKEYDMGHEISDECLADVDQWLKTKLDESNP